MALPHHTVDLRFMIVVRFGSPQELYFRDSRYRAWHEAALGWLLVPCCSASAECGHLELVGTTRAV